MPWSNQKAKPDGPVEKTVETVDKYSASQGPGDRTHGGRVVGIFAKEPIPGQVKTRLSPPFSSEQAALLYKVAQGETVRRLQGDKWDLVVFYVGRKEYFTEHFPGLRLVAQASGGLGRRMSRALDLLLGYGYREAVLVGTDSPDMPLELIEAAFLSLRQNDAVTVPADDGGYVLIGCCRGCEELFLDVPWSSSGVLAATRSNAHRFGISLAEVGTWSDFDDLSGVRSLMDRSPATATAQMAAELLVENGWE